MTSFSIKDLVQRISKTQDFSRNNISDRIFTIKNRINSVYEKISKIKKFSTMLIQDPGLFNKNSKVSKNQTGFHNDKNNSSSLNSKIKNLLLEKLLPSGAMKGQSEIIKNFTRSLVSKIPGAFNNGSNNGSVEQKKYQSNQYLNKDAGNNTRTLLISQFIDVLDNQRREK